MQQSIMAVFSVKLTCSQTGDKYILLSLLLFSHLALAVGEPLANPQGNLLERHRRGVVLDSVTSPAAVRENVGSNVTLYDLTTRVPNRSYVITNNSAANESLFQIVNGNLTLRPNLPADKRKLFDYETFKTFDVMINATNQTDPTDVVMLTVRISLLDVNDEAPVFSNKPTPFYATMATNASPATLVYTVTVTDADTDPNLSLTIEQVTLLGQPLQTTRFQADLNNGGTAGKRTYSILVSGSGNFQAGANYTIKVTAVDSNAADGSLQQISTNIVVRIGNLPPQFFEQSYSGRIYENTPTSVTNWVLEASSNNKLGIQVLQFQTGNALTFQLLDENRVQSQLFDIRAEDGVQRIVNKVAIDYEVRQAVSLIIQVTEAVTNLASSVQLSLSIMDENDNPPTFFAQQYSARVREDLPVGSTVTIVTANDLDSGLNGEVVFSVQNSTYFDVITKKVNKTFEGTIIVKSPMDCDFSPSTVSFNVIASDKGTPVLASQVLVTVTLQNVNDNPPTIVNTTSTISLLGNALANSVVTLIQASDIDGDGITFYFEGRTSVYDIFRITNTSGQIILTSVIPKDKDSYILKVIAVDDDTCCTIKTVTRTSSSTFTVQIVDFNMNRPTFSNCIDYDRTASIKEKSPIGTFVIQVTATDEDRGENGVIQYRIETPDPSSVNGVFQIDSVSGNITVKANIIRGQYGFVQVTVIGRNPPLIPLMEGRCTFRITIIDINDHAPTFSQALYQVPVSISTTPPAIIYQMVATDLDVGENANITYSFGAATNLTLRTFSINILTGIIRLDRNLDPTVSLYSMEVIANDNGKDPNPLTGRANVSVTVSFDSRKPPEWINLTVFNVTYPVPEDAQRGLVISNLSCQSNSDQAAVEFRVYDAEETITSDSKNFMAAYESGATTMKFTLRLPLDFETKKVYQLSIVCQSFGAVVLRAPLLTAVVNVIDANDEVPEFLGLDGSGRYLGSVPENASPGATVLTVTANDMDTTPEFKTVTFALEGTNAEYFQVNNIGNNRADIVTTSLLKLDRENISHYTVQIVAKDGAPKSPPDLNNTFLPNTEYRYIEVTVIDINDNPPSFAFMVYIFNVSENAAVTTSVGVVTATDPDEIDQGLGLDYRFTGGNLLNAFNIYAVTGVITVAKKLDSENPAEPQIYNLTLTAFDQNQLHSASTIVQMYIVDENDNPPIFNPNQYTLQNVVTEEDKSNTPQKPLFLVQVHATDADLKRPQHMRYSLYNPTQSGVDQLFTVDAVSGNVSLIGPLDRDVPPFYIAVTVEAKDELVDPLSSFCDVIIYPRDINDNAPEFNQQYLQGSVIENLPSTYVMFVIANDKDAGNNQTVLYKAAATQSNTALSALFVVKENGDIYTAANVTLLDREAVEKISLVVQAYDLGTPTSLSTDATVTITVIDANDESPFFEKPLYSASVSEKQISGKVMSVSAIDRDIDIKNRELAFVLQGNPDETKFFTVQSIGSEAVISVAQRMDYETDPHFFNFTLRVTDNFPGHENTTVVQITLLDFNDNSPVFSNPEQWITLVEEEAPGAIIAHFNATDKDSGINAEIIYSIDQKSDPRYEFYIDPGTGIMTTRKKLDREVQESMTITILATDKGEIPLTGTATLHITLNDTNDNFPHFRENYQPVVNENVDNSNTVVQVIYFTDPDTAKYGPPFGCRLPIACAEPACTLFNLVFDRAGDGGNGTATIRTSERFDREFMKYYYLPIVTWDMNGQPGSQTGTNTLKITIGDENDNELKSGKQNIYIYNYEGQFSEMEIGRVYADDPDDWDLPDKTFTYLSPENLKTYFIIASDTGMITIKPGLPPNAGMNPYEFSVTVFDKKYQKTVTCTVSVTIQLISDEAVRKSGAVRLQGITAEEFIKPLSGATGIESTSNYQRFRQTVASMLDYPSMNNIEIVSLIDGDNFLDVRFSAHASPYLNPSQGESAIMLNLIKFEQAVGVKVLQVPINLCMDETSNIGCYNYLNVAGTPELVNANGTSYVMARTSLTQEEGCVDSIFPDPVECQGDYCFNGGTCIKDDWGKLSCACNTGFDGPRCQQRRHSFDGKSAAFYQGLSTCSGGRTSIDFITLQEDGLIMFSGPIAAIDPTKNISDYLILELKGGYPYLRLNLGQLEVSLQLTGKDKTNTIVMNKLSDGQWHHLDIDRDNQMVTLTVDHCRYAASTNGTVLDWSPCRISGVVPGPDVLLNVLSLLQLGGRYTDTPIPSYPSGVTTTGFNGCLRNLIHNSKLYDLYYKMLPTWNSGSNGCSKEDSICASQSQCGQNATCETSWQPDKVSLCRCNPGWYGDKCAKEAPTKDLQVNSYFAWKLQPSLITDTRRAGSFQMMYRTRRTTGTLFVLTNADLKTIVLKLVNGKLTLSYDMGQGENKLVLSNATANTGQWTTVRVERYGNEFLLFMDGGEGRNFNYQMPDIGLGVIFEAQLRVTVGALLTSTNVISDDLTSTCVRDIRFNDKWLPLTLNQNEPGVEAELIQSAGINDGCVREDCGPSVTCPAGQFCYPLWEIFECRCVPGSVFSNGECVAACNPNPCLNSGTCSIIDNKPVCVCPSGWGGITCSAQLQVNNNDDAGLGGGAIAGIVIAILVLLILLILLLIFLLTRRRSEKEKILEVDPDDDFIRENVVFYDEEGAGEEDHAAYDITLLQRPMKETSLKPVFLPATEGEIRRRNAPQVDHPDGAPRPDVGNFIKDRINDAENDDPLTDSTREYNFEGGNSDAGSLSSLNTSSSGGSQDYDYLSSWGPKFAKLADMYGAGQNQEDV